MSTRPKYEHLRSVEEVSRANAAEALHALEERFAAAYQEQYITPHAKPPRRVGVFVHPRLLLGIEKAFELSPRGAALEPAPEPERPFAMNTAFCTAVFHPSEAVPIGRLVLVPPTQLDKLTDESN